MKKSSFFMLLMAVATVVILLASFSSVALADQSGDFNYTVNVDEVTITGYTGSGGAVAIPAQIDGKSVTGIGDNAFMDCAKITSVTIPSGVASIGDFAFAGCSGINSIIIPGSITKLGHYSFSGTGLTSVTVPNSITEFDCDAFAGCSSLKSATISNGLTSFGNETFYNCPSLSSVTIPGSVTSIGSDAFYGCSSLAGITIPGSVKSIGDEAFSHCAALKSITTSYGVDSIGEDAFSFCGLTSMALPHSVSSIGNGAFSECHSLVSITIPDSVTSIGDGAFSECHSLVSVTLPDSIASIGGSMFYDCTALVSVKLPNLYGIPNEMFYGCSALKSITIPESVIGIDEGAFMHCMGLHSVTLPKNLASIDSDAFGDCWNLSGAYFLGNAPILVDGGEPFGGCASDFKVYYLYNKTGYTNPWHGYPTAPVALVQFSSQGGSAVPNLMASIGKTIAAPSAPARAGYTFSGWYQEAACATPWNFATDTVTSSITLYAKWTINTYKVLFNSQGGSAVTSKTAKYNTLITAPTVPIKTGYTFSGWYREAACANAWSFTTSKVTGNITLYAKWVINTYTVSFNSQGGSAVTSKTAKYNMLITAPTAPTRSGYTFSGWYKEAVCTNAWSFTTNKVTGNITLYAKWKIVLPIPAGVKAVSASSSSIKVTWKTVSGAAGYEVWREKSGGSSYSLAGSTTATSFISKGLASGTKYYYKVRAYKLVGSKKAYGPWSAIVSATTTPASQNIRCRPVRIRLHEHRLNSLNCTPIAKRCD